MDIGGGQVAGGGGEGDLQRYGPKGRNFTLVDMPLTLCGYVIRCSGSTYDVAIYYSRRG